MLETAIISNAPPPDITSDLIEAERELLETRGALCRAAYHAALWEHTVAPHEMLIDTMSERCFVRGLHLHLDIEHFICSGEYVLSVVTSCVRCNAERKVKFRGFSAIYRNVLLCLDCLKGEVR